MKNFIIIFFVLVGVTRLNAQDFDLKLKQNVDSLYLWEYSFFKNKNGDEKIGTLTLKRKQDVYSDDSTKVITPSITFEIYPIPVSDSISNFESERAMMISCCYPICGATIETTKNFVFWATPWSIISALNCDGVDFTRKNAELIINKVSEKDYNSIEELLKDLGIKELKN
jgi:hypothetical protein